ncbi:PREDICTED: uncharacterized protein LOC106546480, partial [Thamnophis sirtalis]|uniref:Uncharacterized protein LOC106546480 n=1 Tax=Thamnophis sirtalis TaxID=35019 RepID=A0A6I9XYF7_9SAUR
VKTLGLSDGKPTARVRDLSSTRWGIPKVESQRPSSPWRSVDPASPQQIPTLWTNGSYRGSFYSRRPSHLRHAHRKRLRGRPGQRYPNDGLRHEYDPWPSAPLPDHGNSPIGLDSRPISSSEGPQPVLGYSPHGPERGGYARWPVGSSEEEHCLQPGPSFNFHAPLCLDQVSWPIPSFGGEQGLPHYYDDGHAHEDPFHAGCDATPIRGQEHRPPPNAGSSWVPDSSGGHNGPVHFLEPGLQFYPFTDQGPRFHPYSFSYFPQGVGDASTPLSIVTQAPPHYFQAAHGPGYENRVVGFPEEAPWPPLHPRRDLPVHRDVRTGPWSTDGGEGDWGSPLHAEENHPSCFSGPESFPPEEGWVPYSLPCRIPRSGARTRSRKTLPKRPRRANHQRQACAPCAASRKKSRDPY